MRQKSFLSKGGLRVSHTLRAHNHAIRVLMTALHHLLPFPKFRLRECGSGQAQPPRLVVEAETEDEAKHWPAEGRREKGK